MNHQQLDNNFSVSSKEFKNKDTNLVKGQSNLDDQRLNLFNTNDFNLA